MINHKNKFIYTRIPKTASTSITRILRKIKGKKRHGDHYHILDDINEKTKDYFKFTFVRNPWARCVSRYFWSRNYPYKSYLEKNSTFSEFAKSKGPPYNPSDERKFYQPPTRKKKKDMMRKKNFKRLSMEHQKSPWDNQLDWILNSNNEVLTDFIGKVENIQEDFDTICDAIDVPRRKLPLRNKSKHKHYTEYYDDETRDLVAEKYAKDIEYFGYEFGE